MRTERGNIAVLVLLFLTIGVLIFLGLWQGLLGTKMNKDQKPEAIKQDNNQNKSKERLTPTIPLGKTGPVQIDFSYQKDNDLFLVSKSGNKEVLVNGQDLNGFDLSVNGQFLVYSDKPESETVHKLYLYNLTEKTNKILASDDNKSYVNPKIFPDGKKLLYVVRSLNTATNHLTDGEIWIADLNDGLKNQRKLLGDNSKRFVTEKDLENLKIKDTTGQWAGQYVCISEEEIWEQKIGINKISPDGKAVEYWTSIWGMECGGLWSEKHVKYITGQNYYPQKLIDDYKFTAKKGVEEGKVISRRPRDLFWLKGGDIAMNYTSEFGTFVQGDATFYFDANFNQLGKFYDITTSKQNSYFTQTFVNEVYKNDKGGILALISGYKNTHACSSNNNSSTDCGSDNKMKSPDIWSYYVIKVDSKGQIDMKSLRDSKPFVTTYDFSQSVSAKFLDDSHIIYELTDGNNSTKLFLLDIDRQVSEEIDLSNKKISY